MGDRISISYKNGESESTWLYSHWGGVEFAQEALRHAQKVKAAASLMLSMPLDRLEPDTMLVDFIRAYTKDRPRVESNLYLPYPRDYGDNSDNGHFVINLETMELEKE